MAVSLSPFDSFMKSAMITRSHHTRLSLVMTSGVATPFVPSKHRCPVGQLHDALQRSLLQTRGTHDTVCPPFILSEREGERLNTWVKESYFKHVFAIVSVKIDKIVEIMIPNEHLSVLHV